MNNIGKINFDDDSACVDDELSTKFGIPVIHAKSFHKLNQIVGYSKYIFRNEGNIYFRGQSDLYPDCFPSLFRKVKSNNTCEQRIAKLKVLLKKIKNQIPITSKLENYILEPLIQHYGINTSWIDLVDNLWVALWFGLHDYKSVENRQSKKQENPYLRNYVHVTRRKNGFLYILLIHSDALQIKDPGYYLGKETALVDLRIACPSIFLRPHAQHGLLMRSLSEKLEDHNFYKRTVGIVKIAVPDALEWVGDGNLLTHANIYPSPIFDYGYHFLLDSLAVTNEERNIFGTIKVYTLS